jgi:hypothetical protein
MTEVTSIIRVPALPNVRHSLRVPQAALNENYTWGDRSVFRRIALLRIILKIATKRRADKRIRTADLLITRDRSDVAGVCRGLQMPHI